VADERTSLTTSLDFQRATPELKCAGLTDDHLRERAVPPSTLSLLGIVRHLADVERVWFANRFAHLDLAPRFYSEPDNLGGDFDDLYSAEVAEVFAVWRTSCAESREIIAAAGSLEELGVRGDGTPVTLRWILLHLVEEYARHNGHADLLRERLDGTTGV
jgi:hypothetical protein